MQTALPAVGTQWTYEQQVITSTDTRSNGQSGTLSITYQGTTSYRGGNYYTLEFKGLVSPPFPTNFFSQNSDGSFSEMAAAFYNFAIIPNCNSPQEEEVLAPPVDFTKIGSTSTVDTPYYCGSATQNSQASVVVSAAGTGLVATPTGTYAVQVVAGSYSSFGTQEQYTDYVAGNTVIKRDATFSDPAHSQSWHSITTYLSGPLNVAFPGLSMLLAQEW